MRVGSKRIDCVVCPYPGTQAPKEFVFGWDRLRRSFPAHTRFIAESVGPGALPESAHDLPESARVLWMPHSQVVVTAATLERLSLALDEHPQLSAALAHDQHFPAQPGPDYCTLRGLERYLERLGTVPASMAAYTGQHAPRLVLSTAGAMRQGQMFSQAMWIGGAHVHDFSDYQGSARQEMLPLVPPAAHRVLDVGGGEGAYLRALRETRAGGGLPLETHLAEWSAQACAIAVRHVDHVWQGDFTTLSFDLKFDCISFLDSLEHTEHPVKWLARARELLTADGVVLASVPNVGHWSVIADLTEGRWDYSPVGIHCVTHLRFFTERGLHELFEAAGLQIIRLERTLLPCPSAWRDAWRMDRQDGAGLRVDTQSLDTYAFLVQARHHENSASEARAGAVQQ